MRQLIQIDPTDFLPTRLISCPTRDGYGEPDDVDIEDGEDEFDPLDQE